MSLNHPQPSSYPTSGPWKIVSHETDSWCPRRLGNILSFSLLTKLQISLGGQHVQLKPPFPRLSHVGDVPLKSPCFQKGFATHVKVAKLPPFKLRSLPPQGSPQPPANVYTVRVAEPSHFTQHRIPLVGNSWLSRELADTVRFSSGHADSPA